DGGVESRFLKHPQGGTPDGGIVFDDQDVSVWHFGRPPRRLIVSWIYWAIPAPTWMRPPTPDEPITLAPCVPRLVSCLSHSARRSRGRRHQFCATNPTTGPTARLPRRESNKWQN